jgi:hypothetical protein
MRHTIIQYFPDFPGSSEDQELPRAETCHRPVTINIPSGIFPPQHHQDHHEPDSVPQTRKARMSPAIWQARDEIAGRGLLAIPVRGGSPAMIDLIAWDEHIIYFITVRRSRTDTGIRDITTRYDALIRHLRSIRLPRLVDVHVVEIQLWIHTPLSFQVYRVLAGGIMSRSLP